MRRFACHRLYLSSDTCFVRYVVELGDDGKMQRYYPLEEEIYATQWIGGVIVLSAKEEPEPFMPRQPFYPTLKQSSSKLSTHHSCGNSYIQRL